MAINDLDFIKRYGIHDDETHFSCGYLSNEPKKYQEQNSIYQNISTDAFIGGGSSLYSL